MSKRDIEALIRTRNEAVVAGALLPEDPAKRAVAYADRFAAILVEHGFGQARAWSVPGTENVRVYVGRQGFVPVSRSGLALARGGDAAKDRHGITFAPYARQRDGWRKAVAAFGAWQGTALRKAGDWHEAFIARAGELSEGDADFVDFAVHLLAKGAA